MGHSYKLKTFLKKIAALLIKSETPSDLKKPKIFNNKELFETNDLCLAGRQAESREQTLTFGSKIKIPYLDSRLTETSYLEFSLGSSAQVAEMTILTADPRQPLEEFFSIKTKAQMSWILMKMNTVKSRLN